MAQEQSLSEWNGQRIEAIPLDSLVLWTENPRDPMPGTSGNDEIIRHALAKENEQHWQLKKLAKEMGESFDQSELPTVTPDGQGRYIVYDGNRRVILALLRRAGFPTDGDQFELPLFPQDTIACNVCSKKVALRNVLRKHGDSGSWDTYERDLFMYRYMGAEESVLVRMEKLTGMITRFPELNQRYVKEDILNRKHLEEMGLKPDKEDYGVDGQILSELLEAIREKINTKELATRGRRNDPVSVLPKDLLRRVKENTATHVPSKTDPKPEHPRPFHAESTSPDDVADETDAGYQDMLPLPGTEETDEPETGPAARRTRQTAPAEMPLFGSAAGLRLVPGDVNNLYRTLESLWKVYEADPKKYSMFPMIFRMGLRLLAESAARDLNMEKLEFYVKEYAGNAKKHLRQRSNATDITTFLSNNSVSPDKLTTLLQQGAHAYTSTNDVQQAKAISIMLGEMLTISHGKKPRA